ncbi:MULTISPECIES: transposase family protein [unclassified Streptosporangium]|uniref:transposase family protein n=1 Tax=Streptosporangium sp. NPDC005286 TaxID=3154463 RepID=UPI0033A4E9A2
MSRGAGGQDVDVDCGFVAGSVDPIKKKAGQPKLDHDQHTYNKLLRGLRGVGERANALLTVTFKALRRVSLDPWRIGKITQAAPDTPVQQHRDGSADGGSASVE